MQLDRKMIDRLLSMNDEQLAAFIRGIAADAGIDASLLGINPANVQGLRKALGTAGDNDLAELEGIYRNYAKNPKGGK